MDAQVRTIFRTPQHTFNLLHESEVSLHYFWTVPPIGTISGPHHRLLVFLHQRVPADVDLHPLLQLMRAHIAIALCRIAADIEAEYLPELEKIELVSHRIGLILDFHESHAILSHLLLVDFVL